MLHHIHDPDRGASFVEYAAVITLVSIIIASLFVSGIPRRIGDEIAGAVGDALNAEGSGPEVGQPNAPGLEGAEPEGETGGSSGSSGGSGSESVGGTSDSQLPEPADVDTAPYSPEEHAGGATPAVWTGGDDFTVQRTLSWDDVWNNDNPTFALEDRGDYNWYCGELLYAFCYFGGGLAQGADEAIEGAETTLCHVQLFCSYDEHRETLAESEEGVKNLAQDPLGSIGDMWDDFWGTPQRNEENLSDYGAPWKNAGYWIPNMIGGAFKPLRVLGGNSDAPTGENRGGSASCVSNSFVPGTLVVLADGTTKPIESVEIGDQVLATNPETGEEGPREVSDTIIGTGSKTMVEVTVDTTTHLGTADLEKSVLDEAPSSPGPVVLGDVIIATDGHPFWSPEVEAWVDAADLVPGMWLLTPEDTLVQVTDVHAWEQSATVYNLTVDGFQTYYVLAGDTPVLVHNTSRYKPPPGDKNLPGFPEAEFVGKGSPKKGGGHRPRWAMPDGRILEWDYAHGTIEMWTNKKKNSKHMGEFDPNSGNRLPGNKGKPVPGRRLGNC